MKKNVGLTYVSEFSFPKEQGFSGSATPGTHKVKGYMRGGHVKKPVGKGGAKQSMPKNVKAKGGYMEGGDASMHDKLKKAGAEMGYAYGGTVKNTSAEFKQKRAKQATMDHGNQPARRGRNQAEIEAGGTKRLKPGLKKGGVCRVRMPKNVKAKGGLACAAEGGYAEGGKWIQKAIKKPGALRKSLDVKSGAKIPAKKLAKAATKGGKLGRRARLAETLGKMHKAEGGVVGKARAAQ